MTQAMSLNDSLTQNDNLVKNSGKFTQFFQRSHKRDYQLDSNPNLSQ